MHSKNILHRDLKLSNIFLCSNGDIKIGDFGISKILTGTEQFAETMVGTPYYLSPEICKKNQYREKSDIWSLGCVLYELMNMKHAFEASSKH
jgi:NIMA (never in mitosis gene a)-related kinase